MLKPKTKRKRQKKEKKRCFITASEELKDHESDCCKLFKCSFAAGLHHCIYVQIKLTDYVVKVSAIAY